ncbi:unnamed protein product [Prorocentrum cordatum]|uniref:Uncharacterized protein n=1 Tax=Prorocentrum cordatum TaxID=2364126 RepID=A0ABN9X744_9DINO|nr:unnamed protein product [Polarella glacialis]
MSTRVGGRRAFSSQRGGAIPPIWPRDRPPPPRSWRALRPEPEFNLQPIFRGGAMLDGANGGYGKQGKRRREGLQTGRSRARCTAGRWTRARGAGTAAQREPEVLTQGTPGGQGGGGGGTRTTMGPGGKERHRAQAPALHDQPICNLCRGQEDPVTSLHCEKSRSRRAQPCQNPPAHELARPMAELPRPRQYIAA